MMNNNIDYLSTNCFYGKDLLCTQDLMDDALFQLLKVAQRIKRNRFHPSHTKLFQNKIFLMFFHNPSIRTHISFVAAARELGGHAEFFNPSMTRLNLVESGGESIKDAAKVMSRYVAGIGIRVAEDQVSYYGEGHALQLEYARWADVPVINLASDKFHPCQGLADIMTWAEWFGKGSGYPDYQKLKGKNFLLTWAKGELARGWCSVQEALLVASRFGMNITIARPEGYDLDEEVYKLVQTNCYKNHATYQCNTIPMKVIQVHMLYIVATGLHRKLI